MKEGGEGKKIKYWIVVLINIFNRYEVALRVEVEVFVLVKGQVVGPSIGLGI